MDYEKKYKEALEKARQFSEKPYLEDSKGIVEYIFPELKESEDEKIRKYLLDYLHTLPNHFSHNGSLMTDWIAWIEKQGEQKPAWSEEDKKKISELKTFIAQCNGFNNVNRQKAFNLIDALSPQKRWKPSEEQIIALRWVLNNVPYCKHKEEISGLLDQIKDL